MRVAPLSIASAVFIAAAQLRGPAPAPATLYEHARLIDGNGGAPVEDAAFVVDDGRITAIGPSASVVERDRGDRGRIGRRVDLTGRTVMPALVNVHVHIGYEGYATWGAGNYTARNVLDHLQREAFYGVGATVSVGSSPVDAAAEFQERQRNGQYALASRFLFVAGLAPPNGGPDAVLMKGTTALHAIYEVSTAAEARAAVTAIAGKHIEHVKIWVDDRRGTYPKMPPAVFEAVVDEAHRRGMKVHAHATTLADQKAVVRAGVDVLVHTVGSERVDEEFLSLLRERKPYWTTVIGLGDRPELCEPDPFVDETLPPAVVASIRATTVARGLTANCAPRPPAAAARDEILAYNVTKMFAAGARLVLGTDAGIHPGYTFGTADHHEIARWVQFGIAPADAIVAATRTPAELMGLRDMGTLAAGKSADFLVLAANPLDDIRNTRRIAAVYLHGVRLDREALLAAWRRAPASH